MYQTLFQRQFTLSYENLSRIRTALDNKSQALHLEPEALQNIKLVCSEYCANLLEHQDDVASQVTISYGRSNGRYIFSIRDNGSPWHQLTQQLEAAELPDVAVENGMGLALIRATFPSFTYHNLHGYNQIRFQLPKQNHRKQIIIVDDSQSQLTLLAHFLKQDYQLALFSQASEALQWLKKNHCDLVLTDLHMPDIDGFDFRRQVATIQRHRLLPFIFLSADTITETLSAAAQSGIDDFLAKPISKPHLSVVLARVLKRHHHLLSAFEDKLQQQLNTHTFYNNLLPIHNGRKLLLNQEPQISGDFVMQKQLNDGSQLLLLGDQMGHGMAAKTNGAVYFGVIQGLLHMPEITPQLLCQILNDHLYHAGNKSSLICLLILHLSTDNMLTVYNAGMPTPILFSDQHQLIEPSMGLLGLFNTLEINSWQTQLYSGDSLHCYSDGLYESQWAKKELMTIQAMQPEQRHKYLWQRTPQTPADDCSLLSIILTDTQSL
ncbi:response regulator [uncultured Photobacterium sp.]|uniref:response regulator n=1 Tax=uncultured Photobacterium sp. TaxID=173973 RepID=UPI00261C6D1F|nr:response regulator [uncultured Photobacterium sp.]